MGLRYAVLARRIVGGSLDWAKRSLAGHAALELAFHFFRVALFKRISAAARGQPCDHEQSSYALHPRILEGERGIARSDVLIADCGIWIADLDQRQRRLIEDGHFQIRGPESEIRNCMIDPELLLQ